jgi:hypothetical protein
MLRDIGSPEGDDGVWEGYVLSCTASALGAGAADADPIMVNAEKDARNATKTFRIRSSTDFGACILRRPQYDYV